MASVVVHVCVNYLNVYINSSTTHSIEQPSIHQPKSTDVVITMPGALGGWSHNYAIVNCFNLVLFIISSL